MQQLHLLRILLTPSPFSLVAIFIVSPIWVVSNSWLSSSDNQSIYQSIFGSQVLTTQVWSNTDSVVTWITKFFSSSSGYYIMLVMFGLFVGVAAFTLLKTITYIKKNVMNFVENSEDATNPADLLEIFTRLWVRSAALIGWAIFSAVTVNWIVPLVDRLAGSGANYLGSLSLAGVLFYVQALFVCALTLHLHIVFIRLFLLRPRVFGNSYA